MLLAFELGFETPVGDFPFLKLHKSCPPVHLEECSGWKMRICEVFVAENAEVCPSIQGLLGMLRESRALFGISSAWVCGMVMARLDG